MCEAQRTTNNTFVRACARSALYLKKLTEKSECECIYALLWLKTTGTIFNILIIWQFQSRKPKKKKNHWNMDSRNDGSRESPNSTIYDSNDSQQIDADRFIDRIAATMKCLWPQNRCYQPEQPEKSVSISRDFVDSRHFHNKFIKMCARNSPSLQIWPFFAFECERRARTAHTMPTNRMAADQEKVIFKI